MQLGIAAAAAPDLLAGDSFHACHVDGPGDLQCAREADALRSLRVKARAMRLRYQRAAATITRGLRAARLRKEQLRLARTSSAATAIQRAYRRRMQPRLARLRERLQRAREVCLSWRLRRRLRRYVLRRRSAGGVGAGAYPELAAEGRQDFDTAATRIQAFCRGRWCREGWAYCWAPPFRRPSTQRARSAEAASCLPVSTAAMARGFAALRQRRRELHAEERQRGRWQRTASGEMFVLHAWLRGSARRQRRDAREAAVRQRFEAQWAKHSDGLEAFVRAEAEKGDWVSTLDKHGQAVWMSQKTGKTRKSDPIEARVRENLKRERGKALERVDEHVERLRWHWAEEDAMDEEAYAAGVLDILASRNAWLGQ